MPPPTMTTFGFWFVVFLMEDWVGDMVFAYQSQFTIRASNELMGDLVFRGSRAAAGGKVAHSGNKFAHPKPTFFVSASARRDPWRSRDVPSQPGCRLRR